MTNRAFFVIPRPLKYSDEYINLAHELQEEFLMDQVLKTSGVQYSRFRLYSEEDLLEHPVFQKPTIAIFGAFNRLVVCALSMYDISTRAQSWIKVDRAKIEKSGYKWSSWESVMKQLLIHHVIDHAQDKDGTHYYKFRYEILVDCKLNNRKFITVLRNSTKEKSIAQNWSKEKIHDHIKAKLWSIAKEKILVTSMGFEF